ncbi:MAG: proton-conducting membrane transporter [Lachnospiraceae bacterium]|nr:proton-conducting membrane transporter [Lachnospiraceae bacterium]
MFEMMVSFSVFFPILAGAVLFMFPEIKAKTRNIYTFVISLINLAAVLYIAANCSWGNMFIDGAYLGGPFPNDAYTAKIKLMSFTDTLTLQFGVDGLGILFSLLVSILWPFSLLYAFEYMEHDKRQNTFFAFFMMTLGSVLGIAYSGDLFSMYVFYEVLSLVTFPLVMHEQTQEAQKAGRQYLVYMLGGAAFAFVGMIVVMNYSSTLDFVPGGVINSTAWINNPGLMLTIFFITFMGFSVKAAMMPFGRWLIKASVAPMPVTGLLHAVAVVKAGAFATIRLIYYTYGCDNLRGKWPQYVLIGLTAATILYGSGMAIKELHLKRRLAYSTISNLSYVLFGALLMSPEGMEASLTHLVMHAVTKIGLFFCVGAMMHTNNKVWQYEIDGIGYKMKYTFAAFTICGLSLIGVPQLGCFISKLRLLTAVIDDSGIFAYIGGGAILLSALFTAIYLLTTVIKGYFPTDGHKCDGYDQLKEAGWKMLVPIGFAAVMTTVLGLCWKPLMSFLGKITSLM